jgi:hypothetical protein
VRPWRTRRGALPRRGVSAPPGAPPSPPRRARWRGPPLSRVARRPTCALGAAPSWPWRSACGPGARLEPLPHLLGTAARPRGPVPAMAPARRGGPGLGRGARPLPRRVRSSAPTCAWLVRGTLAWLCARTCSRCFGTARSSTPRRARLPPPPPPCILCALIMLFISINGN